MGKETDRQTDIQTDRRTDWAGLRDRGKEVAVRTARRRKVKREEKKEKGQREKL